MIGRLLAQQNVERGIVTENIGRGHTAAALAANPIDDIVGIAELRETLGAKARGIGLGDERIVTEEYAARARNPLGTLLQVMPMGGDHPGMRHRRGISAEQQSENG